MEVEGAADNRRRGRWAVQRMDKIIASLSALLVSLRCPGGVRDTYSSVEPNPP